MSEWNDAIETAAREIEVNAVHKVGRIYAANLAACIRSLARDSRHSPGGPRPLAGSGSAEWRGARKGNRP